MVIIFLCYEQLEKSLAILITGKCESNISTLLPNLHTNYIHCTLSYPGHCQHSHQCLENKYIEEKGFCMFQDQKGVSLYLGVTHQGIMTFHGSRRTQLYKW